MEPSTTTSPEAHDERTLDEAALLARVMRYFDGAIRGLRKRDRLVVLRAADDFWTVMETLSLAPVAESAEYKVRLRGALAKRKLLQMDGGVLSRVGCGGAARGQPAGRRPAPRDRQAARRRGAARVSLSGVAVRGPGHAARFRGHVAGAPR